MNDATRPADAAAMTPQQSLKAAMEVLRSALQGALAAIEHRDSTPGMIGAAFGGLNQAQQNFNIEIAKIPMRLVVGGQILDDTRPESAGVVADGRDAQHPAASIASDNPRVWADNFLAYNKNQAIDRESLTHWFGYAIAAGAQSVESARDLWEKARGSRPTG